MSDWIEINLPFYSSTGDCVIKRGAIAKPGVLLRLSDGTEILLGHCEPSGGCCPVCRCEIENTDFITHYKVIWIDGSSA